MNRIRDAVTRWRSLIDRKRLRMPPLLDYADVESAVHAVLDEAVITGRITPAERESLRSILARTIAGEADAAERTVLSETLCELRGRITPLLARFGEEHRVLHERLI